MSTKTRIRTYWALALALALTASGPPGAPASADTTFPQTGATIWGPFEQYWNERGGLKQFGLPRTDVYPTNGNYDAQWFERALFTYTPTNPDPHKVQLQLLGNIITADRRSEAPFQRTAAMANPSSVYFEATGHNLSGLFLKYWQDTGGLPIYGYPISEVFTERSKSDGKEYAVQYFERNRFELHPEQAGTEYEVQLGLLGSELLDAQGGPAAFANLGPPKYYPPRGTTTQPPPSGYPKVGQAPDLSWIAGQVLFTRIQGGCVFVRVNNDLYVPNGVNWDAVGAKDQDYVVVFGHLARPGEPYEICPGGKPYITDRVILNP
jgi:hypothetical protein